MSDSVRPHRRKPTRLPRPWDSPGKNTGVGCHFLLQCMKVKSESELSQSCPTLSDPHGLQPTRLLRPWDFPGKSTGVGPLCLLPFYMRTCQICLSWFLSYLKEKEVFPFFFFLTKPVFLNSCISGSPRTKAYRVWHILYFSLSPLIGFLSFA